MFFLRLRYSYAPCAVMCEMHFSTAEGTVSSTSGGWLWLLSHAAWTASLKRAYQLEQLLCFSNCSVTVLVNGGKGH